MFSADHLIIPKLKLHFSITKSFRDSFEAAAANILYLVPLPPLENQKYLRCLLLECAEVVDAEVGGRAAGGLCAIVLLEFCLVVLPEQ